MIEVTFAEQRLGRSRGVRPQRFSTTPQTLAGDMYSFVRRHLASREVEIVVYGSEGDDPTSGTGSIIVGGWRVVASFSWRELGQDAELEVSKRPYQ